MSIAAQDFRTHVEGILDALATDPGRESLVHQQRRIAAGEFRDLVHRMARTLGDLGVGRGHTVTLLCGNLPETIAARYAANLIGCRVNHLYNRLSADVQAAIVGDVETHALIVDPRWDARAAEITEKSPVPLILSLGPAQTGQDLLELAATRSAEPVAGRAQPQDVCTIRHTGGTTGHPKGICTTFEQMHRFSEEKRGLWGEDQEEDQDGAEAAPSERVSSRDDASRVLVCTTLAHAGGMFADKALREGGCVVLHEDFDPAAALATIERERITDLFLLPPLLYQLMDHPDADRTDTSSLRGINYGGCQSSPARIADAIRRFGPVLLQFYGQNEAGGISVLPPEDHDPERPDRLRSAGRVLPGVELEIRDESGRALPHGERGEVCVRSSNIMQGYWKQPELTAEVLRDGWLHTGDIGYLDEDGYLTVVDRIKDMIVVVGGHVYTTELEDLLNSHPKVHQSAVFGVRDADRMEQVHAVVVPAADGAVDERELCAMVRAARGSMYEPARITFAAELPLTDAGKPDKKQLRVQAEQMAAAAS